MKAYIKLTLILILIPLTFTACKGDNDEPDTSQKVILTDS